MSGLYSNNCLGIVVVLIILQVLGRSQSMSYTATDTYCDTTVLTEPSGLIESSQSMKSGLKCKYWSINIPWGKKITISLKLDLRPKIGGRCGGSYVKVGPDPEETFCGRYQTTYVGHLRRGNMWVKLLIASTDDHFAMHYLVEREDVITTKAVPLCPPTFILCNDVSTKGMVCLQQQYQCNGIVDCVLAEDEAESLCQKSSSPPLDCYYPEIICQDFDTHKSICLEGRRQCDGKPDCLDYKDESLALCENISPPNSATLSQEYGNFTSSNYPNDYPVNQDYYWTIHGRIPGHKIQLRFGVFYLQREQSTDYVEVYDGKNELAPLIGVYYGGNHPPPIIESSSNWMYIKFHSDKMYTERGFKATYQMKGICIPSLQRRCRNESECYYITEQCDGIWNCPLHGSDERGCGHWCNENEYRCGSSNQCYKEIERCNGNTYCRNNADEYNCTTHRCGSDYGLYLCRNKRCIYETWTCDRTNDCEDHSDEDQCPSPFFTRRVIVAAVTGSLICSLLLVIALGCICKVYALRMHEQYGPRQESPLSRLQAEFLRRRAPPPPYHEAMLTSRPYEEARREYLNQARDQRRTRRFNDRRRNRALPPTPEESNHQVVGESDTLLPVGDNDLQLTAFNATNEQFDNAETSSTVGLIPPTNDSDSDDSLDDANHDDDDDDDNDSVLLDITEVVESAAGWEPRDDDVSETTQLHAASETGCDSIDSASGSILADTLVLPPLSDHLKDDVIVDRVLNVDKDGSVADTDVDVLTGVLDIAMKEMPGVLDIAMKEMPAGGSQNATTCDAPE